MAAAQRAGDASSEKPRELSSQGRGLFPQSGDTRRHKYVFRLGSVRPGTHVEVRSRFESRWSRGFEVSEIVQHDGRDQFRLRRRSDGSELPVLFDADDLREEHRRSTWWI